MSDAVEAIGFRGGPVRTMDSAASAEVVIVRGGVIDEVGPEGILAGHPGARIVDLAGRTLVPGFIDAHNHLSIAALNPCFGDASTVVDRETLVEALRAQAAAEPEGEWVRLHGWNETSGGFTPTRHDLDAAGLDRPAVLVHYSLHQCVVSSRGLDVLAIGVGTLDPQGGEIAREATGEPNGLLVERAWSKAHARSLEGYTDPDRWAELVAARGRLLLREGIVAVHDAACSPEAEALYAQMARDRSLPVSVLVMPHAAAILENDVGSRLDGPRTGDGDHRLRVGPVKLFADGGVAIALDVSLDGQRIRGGFVMADLESHAIAASRAGFRIAVHAIGNVGVQHTIDAFRAVDRERGDHDNRFRIEHAGVSGPTHWEALAALGAFAVVQPGFVEHVGEQSGGVTFDDDHWLAFAGLADAGVTLAGSSDDPCAPFPPLWGAAKGAGRTTSSGIKFEADQSVCFDDWLRAYTSGAAQAGGQEHERGRIAPGLRADLVVLDGLGDDALVAQTWVNGEIVFDAVTETA